MSKLSDLQSRMRALTGYRGHPERHEKSFPRGNDEDLPLLRHSAGVAALGRGSPCRFSAVLRSASRDAEARIGASLYVLIGSERGFCGGFNEAIQKTLESQPIAGTPPKLILVGRKLALKFLEDKRVVASLDGPSAAEEIPLVISQLAKTLTRFSSSDWKIIHNSYTSAGTSVEITSPFEFPRAETAEKLQFPPLLNLAPSDLRPQLFEQYLFALFYGIFYQSFMAENHERLRHMDGALNKLREDEERLRRLSNSLRQETITEELEVIMLSVESEIMPVD